jgi:hypothetical protein
MFSIIPKTGTLASDKNIETPFLSAKATACGVLTTQLLAKPAQWKMNISSSWRQIDQHEI